MTQLQVIGGPKAGASVGTITVAAGGLSDNATFTSYKLPSLLTGHAPITGNVNAGSDLAVDTTGLSGVSAYDWRIVGGATIGTSATLDRALTLAVLLTNFSETSIVVNETIPVDVPQTGTIDILNDEGDVVRITYDSWTGSTFTTSDSNARFDTVEASVGNTVRTLELAQTYIECAVTHSGGTTVSPPFFIYRPMLTAEMVKEDNDAVALLPQDEITHIAVADGDWTNTATWLNGDVPKHGARVLIPHLRTVTYDETAEDVRLDKIRVDGKLAFDNTASRFMLVDTLLITRGGEFECGTPSSRVPNSVTHTITISNRVYFNEDRKNTDLDFSGFDPRLLGRGIVSQGSRVMWGAEKTPWLRTRCSFTLTSALSSATTTSLTVDETPPTTTPASGSLQVIDDAGTYRTINYSSFTGSTFTITSTDFSTDNAAAGSTVYISFAPMAGDTVLTLAKSPTNWWVGDEIVIGGTTSDQNETEVRTISAISGELVTLDSALTYDHDNQNPAITRHDHQPGVGMLSHNIVIQSEDGADAPEWERGHSMDMHMFCKADIWGVEHRFLGRTWRDTTGGTTKPFGKFINDTTVRTFYQNDPTVDTTANARSNVLGRYSFHFHKCSFGKSFVDTMQECSIRGAVGWGAVHHDCEARMNRTVIYDYRGGGMVSQVGNETGEWFENLIIESVNRANLGTKNDSWNSGDIFANGTAFAMRSRALRVTANMAMACSVAYGFYHRANLSEIIPGEDVRRETLDIKDLQRWNIDNDGPEWMREFFDYPIIHVNNNEGVACFGELFGVTKQGPRQLHGYSINISGMKGWQLATRGLQPEYIAQYVLRDNDICAAAGNTDRGFQLGPNVHRLAAIRNRIEGFGIGVQPDNSTPDVNYVIGSYNDTTNPRFIIGGNEYINCTTDEDYLRVDDPTYDHALFIAGALPTEVTASLSGGFVVGTRDGSVSGAPTFQITDSLGTDVWRYFADDELGPPFNGDTVNLWPSIIGYWEITQGDSINGETPVTGDYAIFPIYFSDRLYGTPYKKYVAIRIINAPGNWPNLGEYELCNDPPVVSAATLNVSKNSSNNTLDIGALITNNQGVTCTVSDSYQAPNHGRFTVTGNSVSFTPDPDWTGEDFAYVWVEGGGHAVRVDINITAT